MEKEVESLKSSLEGQDKALANKSEAKLDVKPVDGKELVRLFQKMTVTKDKLSFTSDKFLQWRTRLSHHQKSSIRRVSESPKFKAKSPAAARKKKSKRQIQLRPSRLDHIVVVAPEESSPETESRFSTFSADCSRELETIVQNSSVAEKRLKGKNKDVTSVKEDEKRAQKKRKTSASCAQQARSECLPADAINVSVDLLADYLEESILLPKKMSYMAELMYT
jgi:hypothetical protein